MASQNPNSYSSRIPMYPQIDPNPNPNPNPNTNINLNKSSSSSSLYPTLDMKDLVQNLFPDDLNSTPSAPPQSIEETLVSVPGAILNLIDRQYSVELASGDFSIVRLRQGDHVVAVIAKIADDIQWPLTKDEASVKLDQSHYFFSFRAPNDNENGGGGQNDVLSYGLTVASKGQESLLKKLDDVLGSYSSFSVQRVEKKMVDSAMAKEVSPADLKSEKKKKVMEKNCQAYWTTLAPNVEDYSSSAAKLIAAGSGHLIKGILWCGDVTVDRLKWGNEVMSKRMGPCSEAEISPETLKRIKRAKRVTKMTEKVALGVLSGTVKVSGFFTSSIANSKLGKKIFGLLPGQIVLASLDGFNKVCDAVEVAGKNVMSTSSTVTTGLVNQKYGEQASKATNEGLDAAGHAIGTAWAVFKVRKALNPKGVMKPSALAKSAAKTAAEMKSKSSK